MALWCHGMHFGVWPDGGGAGPPRERFIRSDEVRGDSVLAGQQAQVAAIVLDDDSSVGRAALKTHLEI
jgi:hypothetical protein